MKKKRVYWKLFSSSLYLSAFTFGGGFVIVPLLKKKFVDELGWIDADEMMDLIAIAQSSPGSVSINASILIGFKIARLGGALLTILGTVLPPLVILSVVSHVYNEFRTNLIVALLLKGMQAGIAAVICDVVFTMTRTLVKLKEILPLCILCGSFIATYFFDINVMVIVLLAGTLGAIHEIMHKRKAVGNE